MLVLLGSWFLIMMDDDKDEVSYYPDDHVIDEQTFGVKNAQNVRNLYVGDARKNESDSGDDGEDKGEGHDGGKGIRRRGRGDYVYGKYGEDYGGGSDNLPPKKKLKARVSSYEFLHQAPFCGRNLLRDWNEDETFALLNAWGERFLKQGRKSLRTDEWQEVVKQVCHETKIERTDAECRHRLHRLKKRYRKETKSRNVGMSQWVYFKMMDALFSKPPPQVGLSCQVDSGEYVFTNSTTYLNCSNPMDEMRDSPGNSEFAEGEEDQSGGLPPKITRDAEGRSCPSSLKMLASSIRKFGEIYERVESKKRQQMVELEKMRMDFYRDLELQKRQILESGVAELLKFGEEARKITLADPGERSGRDC